MSEQWTGIQYQPVANESGEDSSEEPDKENQSQSQILNTHERKPLRQLSDKDEAALPNNDVVEISRLLVLEPVDKDESDLTYDPQVGPPPLRYPIQTKKWSIISASALFILLNTILPTVIFYVLRHVFHSHIAIILDVSQIPMIPTLFQFPYRLWQLKHRNGERSPRIHGILTWDLFQWQFLFAVALMTGLSVITGLLESYHLFAFSSIIIASEMCLQIIFFNILAQYNIPQPCRISSIQRGEPFRPALYYIIEDLTAVDGGAGARFRDELAERWNASTPFQTLIYKMGWILGFSGLAMALIELLFMMTMPIDIFFGLSWVIFWTWAGYITYYCIRYTRASLLAEREWWDKEILGIVTS